MKTIETHKKFTGNLARASAFITFLALWSIPLFADTAYLQSAITAKETEIRWKKEDIAKVERDLAAMRAVVARYPQANADLSISIGQLEAAEAKLLEIQAGNLLKLTIRTAWDTYNTASGAIDSAAGATATLLNDGVAALAGSWATDQIKSKISENVAQQLGMDDNSLLGARSQKIKILNENVRTTYPELKRVQYRLSQSLEDIQAHVYVNEGIELGETGAILRKNLMVREAINAALPKLIELKDQALQARDDAQNKIPELEAELAQLQEALGNLDNELAALRQQLHTEQKAEKEAEVSAAVLPPQNLPSPHVTVAPEPAETYYQRLAAAKKAAADALWASQSPPLMDALAQKKAAAQFAWEQLVQAASEAQGIGTQDWIHLLTSPTPLDPAQKFDPAALSEVLQILGEISERGQDSAEKLTAYVNAAEVACQAYVELYNARNRLQELQDVVTRDSYAPVPPELWQIPGEGVESAIQKLSLAKTNAWMLPRVVSKAETTLDEAEETSAPVALAHNHLFQEAAENLQQAENAFAQMVQIAREWQNALSNIPEAAPIGYLGYGYWSQVAPPGVEPPFDTILSRTYSHAAYVMALTALLQDGSPEALSTALGLQARHRVFHANASRLSWRYHSARQAFFHAWTPLKNLGAYWVYRMADSSLSGLPGNATVQNFLERYRLLADFNTSFYHHLTAEDGVSPPVPGQPVKPWYSLVNLGRLDTDKIDDYSQVVAHQLLDLRKDLEDSAQEWLSLPPLEFDNELQESWIELNSITQNLTFKLRQELEVVDPFIAQHEAAANKVGYQIWKLSNDYNAAHPAPVVEREPEPLEVTIPAGESFSTTLEIQVRGDFAQCQWQRTQWPDYPLTWENIEGANNHRLTTPAARETWYYRCLISNRAGSTITNPIPVQIFTQLRAPVITSAAQAQGAVGYAFSWRFTADTETYWWTCHEIEQGAIPGLTLINDEGRLVGVPQKAGVYTLNVATFGPGGAVGTQSFQLTIRSTGQPYAWARGGYNSLIEPTQDEWSLNRGMATVTVNSNGAFSGSLRMVKETLSFRGSLPTSGCGTASSTITRRNMPAVTVRLSLRQDREFPLMGTIWSGDDLMGEFSARRAVNTRFHDKSGRYTVIVPDFEDRDMGVGSGTLNISREGSAALALQLPDGTSLTQSILLDTAGTMPIFASLYNKGGFFAAKLESSQSNEETDILNDPPAHWLRPPALPTSTNPYYREGFRNRASLYVMAYHPPRSGTLPDGFSAKVDNCIFEAGGGGLQQTISKLLTLTPNLTFLIPRDMYALRLSFNSSTGVFRGSFQHPVTKKTASFTGVIFDDMGAGSFPGPSSWGYWIVEPYSEE